MPRLLNLSLALIVAIHPFAASAAAETAPVVAMAPLAAQIDAAIAQYYKPNEPGATVLVVKNGKTVYRKAFGLADVSRGIALTPDMQLRLGSVTKQFTSTAILMLADEGKLRLDDDITRFLPDYPTRGKRITVEHLLNHTSGIVSYTSKPTFVQHIAEDMQVATLINTFKDDPLEFEPGAKFKYNNSGYLLLGAIIENVSGQSYATFMEQRIFIPLGMNDTAYAGRERGKATKAAGHTLGEKGFEPSMKISMSQPYAAGALVSTLDDLAKWDKAVSEGALLKPASWARAMAKATLTDGSKIDYGYGWEMGAVRGVPFIGHGGGINGFATYVMRLPEQKLYVAVLRNSDRGVIGSENIARRAAAAAIGKPFQNYQAVALDAKALDAFSGTYKVDDNATRVVRREGDKLSMVRTGRPAVLLSAFSESAFFLPGELEHFAFSRDAQGKVSTLTRVGDGETQVSTRTGDAPAARAVVALAPAVFDSYAGRYQMAPEFVMELKRDGERFYLTASRQPTLEIFAASPSVFFSPKVDAELRIETDAATGQPTLILDQNGRVMRGRKL